MSPIAPFDSALQMSDKGKNSSQNAPLPEGLRSLRDLVRRDLDYRSFYLRYCPVPSTTRSRIRTFCPIPSHHHSGGGKPSLSIDLRSGLFNCFSRSEGGDAIAFYELMHDVSFSQAVRRMAREIGHSIPRSSRSSNGRREILDGHLQDDLSDEPLDRHDLAAVCARFLDICRMEDQQEGLNYLARRGIDRLTVARAGVTYFPRKSYKRVTRTVLKDFSTDHLIRAGLFNEKEHLTFYLHRLMFPFNLSGQPIYLQARTIATGVEPRWHNMRGQVPSLYNVDALQQSSSGAVVYLVEGFTDTLTLLSHGFQAVGLVGAGGLKTSWLSVLKPFRVVAAFDPDKAGVRAARLYKRLFRSHGQDLAVVTLPRDINDFFRIRASAALELELLTEAALDRVTAS